MDGRGSASVSAEPQYMSGLFFIVIECVVVLYSDASTAEPMVEQVEEKESICTSVAILTQGRNSIAES